MAGSLTPAGSVGSTHPKAYAPTMGRCGRPTIDELVAIDIAAGRITRRVKIADAKFLNDVATAADGAV